MTTKTYLRYATLLSAGGTLFAGYLSFHRVTKGICAFAEPCPFFLGHPACYTGFALFATALVISIFALAMRTMSSWPAIAGIVLAASGMIFAAKMSIDELGERTAFRLGLPTCAYGFVFFAALLLVSSARVFRRAAVSASE